VSEAPRISMPLHVHYGSYRVISTIVEQVDDPSLATTNDTDHSESTRSNRRRRRRRRRRSSNKANGYHRVPMWETSLYLVGAAACVWFLMARSRDSPTTDTTMDRLQRNHLYFAERVLGTEETTGYKKDQVVCESFVMKRRYATWKGRAKIMSRGCVVKGR
jgi:hypothetical protein